MFLIKRWVSQESQIEYLVDELHSTVLSNLLDKTKKTVSGQQKTRQLTPWNRNTTSGLFTAGKRKFSEARLASPLIGNSSTSKSTLSTASLSFFFKNLSLRFWLVMKIQSLETQRKFRFSKIKNLCLGSQINFL